MLERASGQFIIDGQVEDILGGISGAARLARISQSCRFSGQLEGESMAEFTAVLPREGDGSFHGFQRVSGTLGEREGSFVLSVTGEYVKGQPRGSWAIVPKSGSGDFAHIRGGGAFSLPDGKPGKYQLEFDLRKPRVAKAPMPDVGDEPVVIAGTDAGAMPDAANESVGPVPGKPARKPRVRKTEPVAAVVAEASTKRARSRKAAPALPEPVAAPVKLAKRTRSQKSVVATPEQPIAEPAPKPKRSRKAQPSETPVEPTTVATAMQQPAPTNVPRRKQAAPPEPPTLQVTESGPVKRRAKAA